ncbi:MAG TPA: hypothetical protein VFN36_05275 [Solirubrobacteraceae bacterium]|nr:hypothetical protein [Solirubrobacteraceae bacterium]
MERLRVGDRLEPQAEIALTASLLEQVAGGERGRTLRVARPAPTAAFGRLDARRPGFPAARARAVAHGLTPVIRAAGGHAVAYDEGSVVVQLFHPEPTWPTPIERRYGELTDRVVADLGGLGVPVELGELPDEYCAGRFSLHLPDGPKVAGLAQRALRRASLTAAIVVVEASDALRQAVIEIYAALELPLDPATVGGIRDRHPEVTPEAVIDALMTASR